MLSHVLGLGYKTIVCHTNMKHSYYKIFLSILIMTQTIYCPLSSYIYIKGWDTLAILEILHMCHAIWIKLMYWSSVELLSIRLLRIKLNEISLKA